MKYIHIDVRCQINFQKAAKKGDKIIGARFENSAIFLYKDTCIYTSLKIALAITIRFQRLFPME